MTAALPFPQEPVRASARTGSSPSLLRAQSRATWLGADAPSPLALPLNARTDPPVAASRLSRRVRGFADRSLAPLIGILASATTARHSANGIASSRSPLRGFAPSDSDTFTRHAMRVTLDDPALRALVVRIPPGYRHPPTLPPGASHRRRMPAAFPRLPPHQPTATARRPSDGIARPCSALRAIAPCGQHHPLPHRAARGEASLRSTVARAPRLPWRTPSRSTPSPEP